MKLDLLIDRLTPCLFELSTGNLMQTAFSIATRLPCNVFVLQKKGIKPKDLTDEEYDSFLFPEFVK